MKYKETKEKRCKARRNEAKKSSFFRASDFKLQKGVSLYIAILILSLFLAMGFGLSNILLGQIKIIKGIGNSVTAFYAADTGIERVLMNRYDAASSDGVSGTLENGAGYLISVILPGANCDALNFCVKSVGAYKGTKRAIEATY